MRVSSTISINDADINKKVASNNFPFGKQGFKYFITYKDNIEIRALWIVLPKTNIYKGYSDKTKYMYFMIKDEKKNWQIYGKYEKLTNIIKKMIVNLYITYI